MDRDKWIGLAEVRPTSACRHLEQRAFVNVIGLAADQDSFIDRIRSACDSIDVCLLRVDDVETWSDRIATSEPDNEVCADAESVDDDNPIVFGTFVCFPDE
jgi:hypothetical protein